MGCFRRINLFSPNQKLQHDSLKQSKIPDNILMQCNKVALVIVISYSLYVLLIHANKTLRKIYCLTLEYNPMAIVLHVKSKIVTHLTKNFVWYLAWYFLSCLLGYFTWFIFCVIYILQIGVFFNRSLGNFS